ncbi:polyprenyl synthetase family protein [Streptomyces sp. NPDC090106]|uniref:polyprenyl synthetase family protein n=1 Tax=Streptomyces sp. NPDC090106 TaxID=3365946 RepID=UPI003821F5A5
MSRGDDEQRFGTASGQGAGPLQSGGDATAAVHRALKEWLAERGGDPLTEVGAWALASPGKLTRPVLLLESARAVGASPERVLPAAVGMELLHVCSLLHDDILDGDDIRRGRQSAHRRFGAPLALLAGDGLLCAAFEQVARCAERGVPVSAVRRAIGVLATAGRDLAEGVTRELTWTSVARITCPETALADYTEMVRLKTAPLLRAACEIGALLGGGDDAQARALADYGQALGIAFQIRDDLLPYTSTAAHEGKPDDSDLRNARPSLPLLLAGVLGGPEERDRLAGLLADGRPDRQDELTELLEETGALKEAHIIAQEYALHCHAALDGIPPGPHTRTLRHLIGVVTGTGDGPVTAPGGGQR